MLWIAAVASGLSHGGVDRQSGIRGGTNAPSITRTVPSVPAPSTIPTTGSEYTKMSNADRLRLVQWWASAPSPADRTVNYDVIDQALRESDAKIRLAAVIVVRRLAGETNEGVVSGLPKLTQGVRDSVEHLIGTDSDPAVRREAVAALVLSSHPIGQRAAALILQRLRVEPDARVRARLVMAVAELAREGSDDAKGALVESLSDLSAEVRSDAAESAGRLKITAALPKLVTQLTAKETWLRSSVADSLAMFGPQAVKYRDDIQRAFNLEQDPLVRQKLKKVLSGLGGTIGGRSPTHHGPVDGGGWSLHRRRITQCGVPRVQWTPCVRRL